MLSTIIYFIHFFLISESFNLFDFFPSKSVSLLKFFVCLFVSSIFIHIADFLMNLAVFPFFMADLNGIHVCLCPFSGHWWFLHFNFWNLHPAFNLCQCLDFEWSHWGVWLFWSSYVALLLSCFLCSCVVLCASLGLPAFQFYLGILLLSSQDGWILRNTQTGENNHSIGICMAKGLVFLLSRPPRS